MEKVEEELEFVEGEFEFVEEGKSGFIEGEKRNSDS